MPDEVILDVTTIEENVTVETTAGDVVGIQVVAPTGPTGATGPAGPNSVTSATTSDGTANLSLGDLEVVGGEIYTDGEYSNIYTQGTDAHIFTLGSGAEIFTEGELAQIYTTGASAQIYTAGAGATIGTQGANATIYTLGTNATISTAGSAAHIQTNHASAAVKSTNFAAVESGGASLVDGSMQPCLTWSAGGRNLTIPSGTATTFNTTSYTYGTGAAAAHRTALGLDSLFDGKANLSGGNTFTGSQQINGDISSNGVAITNTAMSMRSTSGQQYVARFIGQNSGYAGFGVVATNAASKPFIQFGAGSETAANFSLVMDSGSSLSVRGGNVLGGALLTINSNTSIGINNATPNAAALLDMTSTTKGLLPPRMTTTQRNAISSPPAGLVIYNTTTNNLNSYNGSAWVELVDSADLGTNVANFLEFPTSDNLASALTDENGTGGGFVRAEGATLTSPSLVGPVNLTSQDASTADRVMTRDLSESNHMRNVGIVREIHPACMSFTSASGGSAIVNFDGGFALATPVTANAYSRAALVRAWANYPASTGSNNPCNVPVAFAMCGLVIPPLDANAVVRFVVGEAGSGTPALPSANALSARGFGFEIYWNTTNSRVEIRMFSHDGTSYTTSSTSIAYNASLGRHFSAMVTSDGSGVSKLFYDTSAAGTAPPRVPLTAAITHTAPSSSNYGQPFASVYCINASTATMGATGVRFFSSRLQVGTIY